jgi:hypothetical protein
VRHFLEVFSIFFDIDGLFRHCSPRHFQFFFNIFGHFRAFFLHFRAYVSFANFRCINVNVSAAHLRLQLGGVLGLFLPAVHGLPARDQQRDLPFVPDHGLTPLRKDGPYGELAIPSRCSR